MKYKQITWLRNNKNRHIYFAENIWYYYKINMYSTFAREESV